jgi:hypothetical protein
MYVFCKSNFDFEEIFVSEVVRIFGVLDSAFFEFL